MIKDYYWLTKPGIIYGNTITAAAGFFSAIGGPAADFSGGGLASNLQLFSATIIGLAFIIASACVFNNILDGDIDARMDRTKNRAMVNKTIPRRNAVIFGLSLGTIGTLILAMNTNQLALYTALFALFFYVAVYTPLKRRSVFGTLAGAVPGALPPVVGYAAVANQLDLGALLLFLILVCWQMPHFYSIAIYRFEDYAKAMVPVLPVKHGVRMTKIHILFYIGAFIITTALLTLFNYTGYLYLMVVGLLGLVWLWFAIRGFKTNNDQIWAKKMFRFSLVVILLLSVMISIDSV